MLSSKNQPKSNNEGQQNAGRIKPVYVDPEFHKLIMEQLLPRVDMFRQIHEDWWPKYKNRSQNYFSPDININLQDMIHQMQSPMGGLPDVLKTIVDKYEAILLDECNRHLSDGKADGTGRMKNTLGGYLPVLYLMSDMQRLVNKKNLLYMNCLTKRQEYVDRASETKDPGDRKRLMAFDKQWFEELLHSVASLMSNLNDLCTFFTNDRKVEDDEPNAVPADGQSDGKAS